MELMTSRTTLVAVIVIGGILAGFGIGLALRNPAAGLASGLGLALVLVGLLAYVSGQLAG